jgi:hypothetical protein
VPVFERIRDVFAEEQDPLRIINLRNLIVRVILDCLALEGPSAAHWNMKPVAGAAFSPLIRLGTAR